MADESAVDEDVAGESGDDDGGGLVFMGGAEDKSSGTQDARNRLVVRGFVVMGGVEIKTS